MCYNLYIFNRQGTCLFYQEWSRPKSVKQGAGTTSDDQKMMFGLFFSLKTFAAAMDPKMCAASACFVLLIEVIAEPRNVVSFNLQSILITPAELSSVFVPGMV